MRAIGSQRKFLRGSNALVMGLGLHGGGVATARWLLASGAKVAVTDMRSEDVLQPSLAALKKLPVRYVLGKHEKKDFFSHDLVVVNPGVPRESEYLAVARRAGKRIENDASLFFANIKNPVIAVTGTRGKTTTTFWIAELLKKRYPKVRPSGNTPENALLKEFERVNGKNIPVVAELSSWQLEFLPDAKRAPHIAVITNLYPDHLNRYGGKIKEYADAKANIFIHQTPDDFLVLNYNNTWTKYFLAKKPKGKICYTSTTVLPKKKNGIFVREETVVYREGSSEHKLFSIKRFIAERGVHNLENLLAAVLAVKTFDMSIKISEHDIMKLPTPRMRQEIVYKNRKLTVVNDSCATSPDGTIAAIERFRIQCRIILIAGGTDKMLEFGELARVIKKYIPISNRIFLEGTATTKLLKELGKRGGALYATLGECVGAALARAGEANGKTTVLFSPGAASFEKFLHEFDRGEQFNALVRKKIKGIKPQGKPWTHLSSQSLA